MELDAVHAIEGAEKVERKKKQKEKYQQRQIILPAGMDVGRFIEDSLKMFVYIFSAVCLKLKKHSDLQ